MTRDEKLEFITANLMETSDVLEYLGISARRLSELKSSEKLVPVLRGIYLREDVENRKLEQDKGRAKYYKSK